MNRQQFSEHLASHSVFSHIQIMTKKLRNNPKNLKDAQKSSESMFSFIPDDIFEKKASPKTKSVTIPFHKPKNDDGDENGNSKKSSKTERDGEKYDRQKVVIVEKTDLEIKNFIRDFEVLGELGTTVEVSEKLDETHQNDIQSSESPTGTDGIKPNEKKLLEEFNKLDKNGQAVARATILAMQLAEIPATAPELYSDRPDRSETPPMFIKRVYASYLGKGLCRPHLLELDRPLYQALSNWLRRNEMPQNLDLPTRVERRNAKLKKLFEEDEAAAETAKKVISIMTSALYRS